MIGKLAFRNLFRNKWRSLLTGGGVAVAVTLLVFTNGFIDGYLDEMIRGATSIETGQAQIQTNSYAEEPKIWKSFPASEELYERVAAVDGVESVAPRVEFYGLVGTERRSQVSRIVGVDPQVEGRGSPLREAVAEGKWFSARPAEPPAPREALVGIGLARQIGVGVGDELVVFAEAKDGSLGNELLRVVGLLEAGNTQIDRQTTFLRLEDAQFVAAMDGEIHELSIRTDRIQRARELAERVGVAAEAWQREKMAGMTGFDDGEEKQVELVVRPWQKLVPELHQIIDLSRSSSWIFYLIIYFIAALGILNTQRMSALERHREFGVMQAIGMSPRRLFATVMLETTLLTMMGAVVGASLGAALNLYFAAYGFNMGVFAGGESFSYMGIAFSERIHFAVTLEGIATPVVAILPVALLCGLWPAVSTAGLNPAVAVAGRD